jgi:hypothetical protein
MQSGMVLDGISVIVSALLRKTGYAKRSIERSGKHLSQLWSVRSAELVTQP